MELIVLGFNFKTHSIAEREAWSIPAGRQSEFLQNLVERDFVRGAVYLPTCNRVELYAVVEKGADPLLLLEMWRSFLGLDLKGLASPPPTAKLLEPPPLAPSGLESKVPTATLYTNGEALLHLARVASGLDSMVLGETEVFGQVKEAYDFSLRQKTVCALLNQIFQKIFQITKKVRTETGISRYPVSVSSVALLLLEQVFGEFQDMRALVLGLGEMGRQTALALSKRGVKNLVVVNRTESKAREFVEQLGGNSSFAPWEKLPMLLPEMSAVVCATAAPHFVLSREMIQTGDRFKVLIDLGVPRDIDPAIGAIENLFLYNVDDLKEIAGKNLASREREASLAMGMMEKEIASFLENGKWKVEGPAFGGTGA